MFQVRRVGHVVLKVRDLARSERFYRDVLGFQVSGRDPGGQMLFFSATGANHHDLALLHVGANAPQPPPHAVGMYHFALEVGNDDELRSAREVVRAAGALTGQSDHIVSHSIYGVDPDGNEFELYCDVDRAAWEHLDNPLGATPRPLRL